MPDRPDPWPERIRAASGGLKDVLLALAAIATIWIQRGNEGKLDVAAAKTEVAVEKAAAVESKLEQTTAFNTRALTTIAEGVDASVKGWKAYTTKDPDDMNVAAEAIRSADAALPAVLPPKENP